MTSIPFDLIKRRYNPDPRSIKPIFIKPVVPYVEIEQNPLYIQKGSKKTKVKKETKPRKKRKKNKK